MKKIILIALTLVKTVTWANIAHAQESIDHQPLSYWFLMINNKRINKKWDISNETHVRFTGPLNDAPTVLIRPWVTYHISEWVMGSIGYSYISNKPSTNSPYYGLRIDEQNIWLQLQLRQKHGKLETIHRFRQENRWPDKMEITPNGDKVKIGTDYFNRFRYRLTANMLIYKYNNKREVFATAFDELWINQTSSFMPKNVARNWLFGGIGNRWNANTTLQIGCMHQWDPGVPNKYTSTPIIQTVLVHNF